MAPQTVSVHHTMISIDHRIKRRCSISNRWADDHFCLGLT